MTTFIRRISFSNSMAIHRQKYSRYLPLYRFSQPGSRAVSEAQDTPNSPKLGGPKLSRSEARELASKRRSTMNSRDAAYDDEQLRRAIEASREVMDDSTEGSITRRPKRGRSDSEGYLIFVPICFILLNVFTGTKLVPNGNEQPPTPRFLLKIRAHYKVAKNPMMILVPIVEPGSLEGAPYAKR